MYLGKRLRPVEEVPVGNGVGISLGMKLGSRLSTVVELSKVGRVWQKGFASRVIEKVRRWNIRKMQTR